MNAMPVRKRAGWACRAGRAESHWAGRKCSRGCQSPASGGKAAQGENRHSARFRPAESPEGIPEYYMLVTVDTDVRFDYDPRGRARNGLCKGRPRVGATGSLKLRDAAEPADMDGAHRHRSRVCRLLLMDQ